jgi:transcriptional regulator with XRE-family HTH domain
MPRPAAVSVLLGRRMLALRSVRRLTQEQLGERAGVSGKFIGQIERGIGNPSLKTMATLAQALNVELWELLHFEETRAEGPPHNAARAYAAAERVASYFQRRPAAEVDRALRILDAALGEPPRRR